MTSEPTFCVETSVRVERLYIALELSAKTWVLCFAFGNRYRTRSVGAGDWGALLSEVESAKVKLGAPASVCIASCYEAGRDGFWIHRYLVGLGVENTVVDSSSIEVNRRRRRAKTDRLDAKALVKLLVRHYAGPDRVWSAVAVPSCQAEDDMRLGRELKMLTDEITRHVSRIKSHLARHGARLDPRDRGFLVKLRQWRGADGEPIPPRSLGELTREHERLELVLKQHAQLRAERKRLINESKTEAAAMMRALQQLKGIGEVTAHLVVTEAFGWRTFANRKKAGAFLGLVGTPYLSGSTPREQGISKAGPGRLRGLMVQIAWCWLRFQPNQTLSVWFKGKFGQGKRSRKVGIIALARKLWIALWRLAHQNVVPDGALVRL